MVRLEKSNEKFFDRDVYLINGAKDLGVTTVETCPHCKEKHAYRVHDSKQEYETDKYYVEVYDCKCPSCNHKFDIKVELEKVL